MSPEEKKRVREIFSDALIEHNRQIKRLANEPERMTGLGTPLTEEVAKRYVKPFLYVDLDAEPTDTTVKEFRRWVQDNNIRILNLGGPRESHQPGVIYARARQLIERLLRK